MIQEDFYTGQPIRPPDEQENEAANMASFGKYDYDPGARAMSQQQIIYPGGYGFGNFMNPPQYGVGGTALQYSQFGNPMPTYGFYQPNPVLQGSYFQQPQVQQQPTVYHIPGISQNGEYLPPLDYQEKLDRLEKEYWIKLQEQEAKQSVDRKNSVYGYGGYNGYNYYGVPFYNPYQYNSLNSELNKEIEDIKQEARESRKEFDMRLSRLAHNICGHIIDDAALEERYQGKDIEIPVTTWNPQMYQEQMILDRLVPFDNSQFYRDQWAKVSEEFNNVIGKDATLKDTFLNMGIIYANWEMEEEEHRRKDVSTMYSSEDNAYKYYVKRKAEERYAREKGIPISLGGKIFNNPGDAKQSALQQFPTLSNAVQLADDGTLNVKCNFGSNAGKTYSVINSEESDYEEKRERFGRFLNSIPGSIYTVSNGS